MTETVCLIGIGNILLSDEGVGVHAVNAIKERYTFSPHVEIIDGVTMGLDLLSFFEGRDKVLIVDAVDFGKEPGHTGIIENNDIPSALDPKFSVHHIGLSDVLFAAKLMEKIPSEVCLIGIQPKSLDVGLDMTDEINGKIDKLVDLSISKLRGWGINVSCRTIKDN